MLCCGVLCCAVVVPWGWQEGRGLAVLACSAVAKRYYYVPLTQGAQKQSVIGARAVGACMARAAMLCPALCCAVPCCSGGREREVLPGILRCDSGRRACASSQTLCETCFAPALPPCSPARSPQAEAKAELQAFVRVSAAAGAAPAFSLGPAGAVVTTGGQSLAEQALCDRLLSLLAGVEAAAAPLALEEALAVPPPVALRDDDSMLPLTW